MLSGFVRQAARERTRAPLPELVDRTVTDLAGRGGFEAGPIESSQAAVFVAEVVSGCAV